MDKLTQNQQLAIDVRNSNVLVSAAAGSGKTSVLVERIIRRITDPDNPVDIDRLLIMTFTKAAAAEMRDRIRDSIKDERQALLCHKAMITTIHGFCQSVVSDHFEELSIDPAFRVADENECLLIKQDAIEECLEAAYGKADPAFLKLVECFSDSKGDSSLESVMIPLHSFIMANPEPEEFAKKCCEAYDFDTFEEFTGSELMTHFKAHVYRELAGVKKTAESALKIIDENEKLEPYRATIEALRDGMTMIENEARKDEMPLYDCVRVRLNALEIPSFGRVMSAKLDDDEKAAQETVKKLRKDAGDRLGKLAAMMPFDLKTTYDHLAATRTEVHALTDLVLEFGRLFDEKKREKNVIDFNDMEHMAIKVLQNPEIAAIYREQFAEIYVDEYQDTNMSQETLVRLICREDPPNVFQVGDVKQSIYRFRHARPDLFLEKYITYTDEPGINRRILLNDNFRSRREVVDAVNEVFSKIMKREIGGIEYDSDAALKYGATCYENDSPCEGASYRAELVIGEKDELSKEELAANIIADRIVSMISSHYLIYDKGAKIMRPASYRDFTILVRSVKAFEPVFRRVFAARGIPLSVSGREGYFMTLEIRTVLAFLTAVDNSRCDIELATVIRSPIGGFSDKDLANLAAVADKKKSLYERLRDAADQVRDGKKDKGNIPEELRSKCQNVIELLDRYKVMSTYMPVHALITHFIDNEYGDYVRCMSNPAQRVANLQMLLSKAEDFGRSSFRGLYQFVRYMEQIRKYEIDNGEAGITGENDDVVRIMTMHGSKGLEFPVCFLAGLEKNRNTKDESGAVIRNTALGLGLNYTDLENRIVTTTFPREMVRVQNRIDSVSEEMRLLYVAMTRAREKLIMVCCGKEGEFEGDAKDIINCLSYMDMLKAASGKDKGFEHIDIVHVTEKELVEARFEEKLKRESVADDLLAILRKFADKKAGSKDEEDAPECMKLARSPYPYTIDPDLVAKLSVSDIKHRAIEEEIARGASLVPEGKQLFSETEPDHYIPKFMRAEGETATGGTFYGTAFHRIMELWDYPADKDTVTRADVSEFAQKMHERHRMEEEQVKAIRPDDVAFFLNSDLADRMKKAKAAGKLFREQPFVIGVPRNDETVLVQGIIDAYFVEDDGITIVDYKTDRVTDEEMLKGRYHAQLEYYGKALSQITGQKIKELAIYSTCLRKEIII